MKKRKLMVLAMVAVMVIGLGTQVWGKGEPKDIFNRGISMIHDLEGDTLLIDCDSTNPDSMCSLPAGTELPGYADIENARITEVGRGQVDMSITPCEPIPAEPTEAYLAYYWQFQDVCSDFSDVDKNAMVVTWDGNTKTWSGNWAVISCTEPEIELGTPVGVSFEEGGVRVRALMEDLLTKEGSPLKWFAGVRRLPFDQPTFTKTLPVDVVPEVLGVNFSEEPPSLFYPEDLVWWEVR